jgi:hypothetical protein
VSSEFLLWLSQYSVLKQAYFSASNSALRHVPQPMIIEKVRISGKEAEGVLEHGVVENIWT